MLPHPFLWIYDPHYVSSVNTPPYTLKIQVKHVEIQTKQEGKISRGMETVCGCHGAGLGVSRCCGWLAGTRRPRDTEGRV